ncbi:MAG: pyridoxamine 5'-phosphate oxidase family protein [Cyclobacteriaceae bacterium]|nr:pyridoxamine 5'-phosphate oxidase family protein [Cyclobacteriaceae bacterium]
MKLVVSLLSSLKENRCMGTIKNLIDEKGLKKLKELIDSASMCHFVTALDHKPLSSRPMSTQEVDEEGNIWFFSPKSSQKNQDIEMSSEVQLFYSQSGASEFLTVYGHAEILVDHNRIERLWNPLLKAWFSEGQDDPDLTLIKVTPQDAYYWDTKNNRVIQLVKLMAGALLGKPMDDGIEGRIKLS